MIVFLIFFFFFSSRRRHTRFDCDWSSDVCSSDLYHLLAPLAKQHILFNLFNYLTFRAAGATAPAPPLAFLWGPAIIPRLRGRDGGQGIPAGGPARHHTEGGTPAQGGPLTIPSPA